MIEWTSIISDFHKKLKTFTRREYVDNVKSLLFTMTSSTVYIRNTELVIISKAKQFTALLCAGKEYIHDQSPFKIVMLMVTL